MKTFLILVLSFAVLSGCNTMHGFGQDIEHAGEAIQNKSSK
ncbi:MAG: entericidin A/B family lipoprotein [Methylophilus sp.]